MDEEYEPPSDTQQVSWWPSLAGILRAWWQHHQVGKGEHSYYGNNDMMGRGGCLPLLVVLAKYSEGTNLTIVEFPYREIFT